MAQTSRFNLRPYQQDALDSIPESGAFLVCMATGLGKTVTFSHIPRKGRMLILSHRDELVHQPEKYFDCSFGIEQAEETSHGEEVISASVQTLVKRLNKFKPDDFDVLITDEAHHATAPTYRKIYGYFKPRLHLGFTATPNRNDGVGLKEIYQDIIFDRNLKWGIENGYLSNINCLRVQIGYSLENVITRLGDYAPEALDKAVNIEKANNAVAEAYKLYAKPPCLIFCASVEHAENLARLIPNAASVKGGQERSGILEKFANGEIPCITNCMVFTEGTDIPNINTVIIARPTKNISLYSQMVGRGTRLYEGKEYLTLIDCVGTNDIANLCTAPSLLGLKLDNVAPELRTKLQGNLFDIPEILESFSDTPEARIMNVEHVNLWAYKNHYNTHNINFFRMPDGSMSVLNIYIPPEDSLGRIKWDGALMPAQHVLDKVFMLLQEKYSDKKALWDLELVKRWGAQGATDKQKSIIAKKFPKMKTENMTRFQAHQLMARIFAPEPPTAKQIYFLRRHGRNADNLTKREAAKLISELKSL